MNENENKRVLICSGGGYRCAWSAGFLHQLGRIGINKFDKISVASGTSLLGLYSTSDRWDLVKESVDAFSDYAEKSLEDYRPPSPESIVKDALGRGGINPDSIQISKNLIIRAYSHDQNKTIGFSNISNDNIAGVLEASMSLNLPRIKTRKVEIGGVAYHDSIFSSLVWEDSKE